MIVFREIRHVRQETQLTCGQACIAMVAGVTFQEAVEAVGHDRGTRALEVINALIKLGCTPILYSEISLHLCLDRVYMVGAPSLNAEAGTHWVVVDYRTWKQEDYRSIYDPQEGNEGKRFYSDDGRPLESFATVIEIL